jgi:shikimate dehydrogenase
LKLASENVAELFLVNRTRSKADAVVDEIRRQSPSVQAATGFPNGGVDLVLNATSLGLQPGDAMPLDEAEFPLKQVHAVYDMIYRPAETPLLRAARLAGCKTANGLGMLLHQGAKAFELWTGRAAPLEVMRRALAENIYAPARTSA